MEVRNYPNPGIAAVLSFLFTGLGQIYNGQIKKGLILICISGAGIFVLIIGAAIVGYWMFGLIGLKGLIAGLALAMISILTIAIAGIYNIYDAYNTAKESCKL